MALTLGLTGAAFAQQPGENAGPAAENQTLDEVTVTGSRIRRTTDFDTANPTTVVDADYLKNLGIVNVGDVVKQLPANVSNNTPNTTGNANFFAGSTIANLRGLNPFFGSRTLTLVNSHRFVPTNQGDGVDLNFIPSVLIQRVDIVTGGASAAYGSGAVSGVQNIFLDRKLEGGRLEVDFGQTSQSDGDDKHVGAAYGMVLGEKSHFTIGAEWQDSDPIGCFNARTWCSEGQGFLSNPVVLNPTQPPANQRRANGSDGNGPAFILGSNVRKNQMTTSGVFMNTSQSATTTQGVNAAGNGLNVFNLGQQPFSGASATNDVVGGDGRSIYQYTNLRAPVDRKVVTGTFTTALGDAMNLNVDLSWGKVVTTNITGALDAQNATILGVNAFVLNTPGLQPAFVGAAGNRRALNKDWTEQLDSHSTFTTKVKRASIGLDGKFGDSSWGWDAYYQYGDTDRRQLVADNRHLNAYLMATDAVVGPGGQVMCRVTRDGFAAATAPDTGNAATSGTYVNDQTGATGTKVRAPYFLADPAIATGCVPLNPFGNGPIADAARAYAFGFLQEDLSYKQQVLAANFSGDVWKGFGAGPIQTAIGVEYRKEEGENIGSQNGAPDYVRTDYLIQYGESFAGDVTVTEGYLETNVPLLAGVTGAQKLEFNVAARESHYKNEGGFGTPGETKSHNLFTWKAQGIWDPVDWFRIRATQSRDARAANFRELYYGQKIKAGGTFGFCSPVTAPGRDPCNWSLEGNSNLDPEKSDTTTVGFVLTPKDWIPGLQFAADYFRIDIEGAIQQANVRRVLDGCQISGIAEFCALLEPDIAGDFRFHQDPAGADKDTGIANLRAVAFNGSGYMFKGVDFSGSYLWQMTDASNLNFRLIATKMIDQLFQPVPGQPFRQLVGQTGTANSFLSDNQPTAEWQANLSGTFNRGPLSATYQIRYVSDGVFNYIGSTSAPAPAGGAVLSSNRVPSYAVSTLSGTYSFENRWGTRQLQVFGVISNLFDRDPPLAVGNAANQNGGTNAVFFDTQGRTYRLGVRVAF